MSPFQTPLRVRVALLLSLWAVVGLASGVQAATVTINFEVDAAGNPLPSGSIIDLAYQDYGVTFSREFVSSSGTCQGDNVYVNDTEIGSQQTSEPNVVTACDPLLPSGFPAYNNSNAWVRADLDRDATEICVAVIPDGSVDFGTLEIFDDQGGDLGSVDSSQGSIETICIQGQGIRAFRFAGDGRFASFDDLRITYGPNRVEFDTSAGGAPIANGAVVDDLFVGEGVRFEKVNGSGVCGGDFVYASSDQPTGFGTEPNVVTVCDGFSFSDFSENTHGRVRASFPTRVGLVCVETLPSGASDQAVLRGFDVDDQQVAETISEAGNSESRICVFEPTIRAVEFAGYQGGTARFDNLDFEFGAAAIDFDVDINDQPIANGTVVNGTYARAGVQLEAERVGGCGTGNSVYANGDTTGDFASSPNQVSLCNTNFSDFSETGNGMVHATFAAEASAVCIAVRATKTGDAAVLRAYDSADAFLGESISALGATETLCVSGGAIRGVRFAGLGAAFARFDDLEVSFVPEPSAAVLGWTAAAVLLGLRRRAAGRPLRG